MIQEFVDRWLNNKGKAEKILKESHPENYKSLVKLVIEIITSEEDDGDFNPDPERIHQIDDGHYQGTLLFVIPEKGYQPSDYWYAKVFYGSCSACDTLESIREYDDKKPNEKQVKGYMTLCLHIVEFLKKMGEATI